MYLKKGHNPFPCEKEGILLSLGLRFFKPVHCLPTDGRLNAGAFLLSQLKQKKREVDFLKLCLFVPPQYRKKKKQGKKSTVARLRMHQKLYYKAARNWEVSRKAFKLPLLLLYESCEVLHQCVSTTGFLAPYSKRQLSSLSLFPLCKQYLLLKKKRRTSL